MGADDRLPADALIARLIAQPHGFDLFQAIHLLERAQPWARALGYGDGTNEAVRLKGFVSLAFEASDIRSVQRHPLDGVRARSDEAEADDDLANDAPLASDVEADASVAADADANAAASPAQLPRETYTLTTPVMSLAGASGPLPMPFTEMVLNRRAARETAMADLLDIFNHRFLSFLYRSRQKYALGLHGRAADGAALTACLDALGNLGLHAAPRGPGGARLWLRHAGLLGGAPRSMTGLLALLSDRLRVKVQGAQFVGGWRSVDAADSLRLSGGGMRGSSSARGSRGSCLGGLAVLGRRTWDQSAGVRIEFLDLSDATFAALLPGGDAHELAAWLVRSYLQQDHDVFFVLHRQRPVLGSALGGNAAARLGWTSWVGTGLGGGARGDAPRTSRTSSVSQVAQPTPVRLKMRAVTAVNT
ncbi:type VI secretion system baseplate subunit TssG [Paraburkholderia panacisoli]|uniref:Type VI secretion system baseplate subunit TssG n=2 Tax=Paraburkholderia panacisoli TaxID=2603818 RepID=A0A5B0GA65_9BURK|nr:type VI secretion system baseplate subunit TssG [Paraburkholderia panacisoli]